MTMGDLLRIDYDPNAISEDELVWGIMYDGKRLEEVESELSLHVGMKVVLVYEDDCDHFEVPSVLVHQRMASGAVRWVASPDWTQMRRLK